MAVSIRTSLRITGDDFKAIADRARDMRPLMNRIGVLMLSTASGRLPRVLTQSSDTVRSGRLSASLRAGGGVAGGDTVFRVSGSSVVVGSNLPYAAQVQFGGTILPKEGKALAIPLLARLKRQALSPRDFPRKSLAFIPAKRKSGGLIGFLVDADETAGKTAGKRGKRNLRRRSALFMLVAKVTQKARPFLFFDAQDERDIEQMTVDYLDGKA